MRLDTDHFERPGLYVADQSTRILLVDDDPILREFAQVYLSALEVTIEVAADGAAGFAMLLEGRFNIALIDIEMPGMDGLQLVEKIRGDERLRHLPVIMVTGREDVASIDASYQVGATAFATKPVNWRQLSHQIRYVIRSSGMEAATRAALEQAEKASRLKSNMLTLLQHELRTPLNSVIGFAGMMAKEQHGPLNAEYRDYARHIAEAGNTLLGTFVELIHGARLLSGDAELSDDEYDARRVIADALVAAERRLGAPLSLQAVPLPPGLSLICDKTEIARLIGHLIVNAETHGRGATPPTLGANLDHEGRFCITIADHGPGLSPERLRHCLELFGQNDNILARSTFGLGLGLPLARRIADLQELELTFDSPAEGGFHAFLRFPARRVVAAGANYRAAS